MCRHGRLVFLLSLLAGMVPWASAMRARGFPAQAGSTIDRRNGGVVFELGQLTDYQGAPLEELRLYRWDAGTESWAYAPFQVDERIERGKRWVSHDDGAVDADDEFVALVRSLGGRAPATAWPESADDTVVRYDLKVTDPLDSSAVGWLHVFRSTKQPQAVPTMVSYTESAGELRGTDYRLVQARTFPGLETLELFDSAVDILDRTKLRARVYAEVAPRIGPIPLPTFVFDEAYTEESQEVIDNAPEFNFRPVKQGPVRIVLEPDGSGFAYPDQVQLFAAFGRLDVPEIPADVMQYVKRLELHARVTIDFSEQATVGRYADSNRPSGVPIDGRPESVPERPISDWRQIDTPYGGIVLVVGRPAAMRELRTYYSDAGRDEAPGTGDSKAYGDNGVFTEELKAIDRITDFLGWLVVIPKDSPVIGGRIAQEVKNPVQVEAIRVVRELPPTPVRTVTPEATSTPTAVPSVTAVPPTPTASATSEPLACFLPYVVDPPAPTPTPTKCIPEAQLVDVAEVIDTSTSMSEATGGSARSKLDAAIAAAEVLADLLKTADRVTVIGFNSTATVTTPLTADRDRIRAALRSLPATRAEGTRIDHGILSAMAQLDAPGQREGRQRAIVLVTDGIQVSPAGGDDARAAADRAKSAGMTVITVGIGDDLDGGLLRTLASRPGLYYPAPDAEDLLAIYREIARVIPCPGAPGGP